MISLQHLATAKDNSQKEQLWWYIIIIMIIIIIIIIIILASFLQNSPLTPVLLIK